MNILLTNDDGHRAPGLLALHRALTEAGHRVTVIAPNRELSGVSHAITLADPIAVRLLNGRRGLTGWSVKGTPADCVKLAYWELMKTDRPALVAAGINRGANLGLNLLYSGTLAAAREAGLLGLAAMAFSLDDHSEGADFEPAARLAAEMIDRWGERLLRPGAVWNVNFPARSGLDLSDVRTTRQSLITPVEQFIGRHDPRGNDYFWQDQERYPTDPAPDSDLAAVRQGLVSLTPVSADLTDQSRLDSPDPEQK